MTEEDKKFPYIILMLLLVFVCFGVWVRQQIKSNEAHAALRDRQLRTHVITTKDGQKITGHTYYITNSGVLHIDDVGVERNGWSIKK